MSVVLNELTLPFQFNFSALSYHQLPSLSPPQAPEPLSSLKAMAERAALGSGIEGEISNLHVSDRGLNGQATFPLNYPLKINMT